MKAATCSCSSRMNCLPAPVRAIAGVTRYIELRYNQERLHWLGAERFPNDRSTPSLAGEASAQRGRACAPVRGSGRVAN